MWGLLVLLTPFEIIAAVMAGVFGYTTIEAFLVAAIAVTVFKAANSGDKNGET